MLKYKKIKKKHYAQYGNTLLRRGYCEICKSNALLIDGKLACCGDEPSGSEGNFSVQMSETVKKRKRPSKYVQEKILEIQDGMCFYCDSLFGEPFLHPKTEKVRFLRVCYDHYVPYSYSQNNNTDNFVATCQVCNGIKTNKIFESKEDARVFILDRRRRLGYKEQEV